MKNILFLLILVAQFAYSQTPALDYGINSVAYPSISTQSDEIKDMVLDNSNRIVAIGQKTYDAAGQFNPVIFLTRINSNGTTDAGFGVVNIDPSIYSDYGYAIAIQPDNKIIICGSAGGKPFIVKLTESGSYDNSFGTNGIVILNYAGSFNSVLYEPETGKVTAGGYYFEDSNSTGFLVARLNSIGQLDFSFNNDGIGQYSLVDDDDPGIKKIIRKPNGSYACCGALSPSTTTDACYFQLSSTGFLDTNFHPSGGGFWRSFVSANDSFEDMVLLPNGNVLVTGYKRLSGDDQYWVVRFTNTGYDIQNSWFINGENVDSYAYNIGLQCDGKILVSGRSGIRTTMIRLNPDLNIDPTLISNGTFNATLNSYSNPWAMVVKGTDVYLGGFTFTSSLDYNSFIYKLNLSITVASPSIAITPTAEPLTICAGQSKTLTATGTCATCTVEWYRDNTLIPGTTGNQLNTQQGGVYKAKYINSACGSGSTSSFSNSVTLTEIPTPQAPSIMPSTNTTICIGQSLQLSASSSCQQCSNIVYEGNSSVGSTPYTINSAIAGTKTYTVRASNAGCLSAPSSAVTITVAQPPTQVPSVFPTGSVSICNGQSQTLSVNNIPNGQIVRWYRQENGNTPVGTGSSLNVTTAGNYFARFSIGSCEGTNSGITVVNVVSVSTPTVSTSSAVLCTGQSVTLSATGCNNCQTTWYNGSGQIVGSGNVLNINSAGSYYATFQLNNCQSGTSNSLTIVPSPVLQSPILNCSNISPCVGEQITLSANGNCSNNCFFPVYAGNGQLLGNAPVSFIVNTTDQLSFTAATTSNGCSSPTTAPLFVSPIIVSSLKPVLSFTGTTNICVGEMVNLNVQNVPIGYNVVWYEQGNLTPFAINTGALSLGAGKYYAKFKLGECEGSVQSDLLTIVESIPIKASIGASSSIICPASTTTLSATGCSLCTIRWYKDGLQINANTPTIQVSEAGEYTAVYTNNGCEGELSNPYTLSVAPPIAALEVNSCQVCAPQGSSYKWYLYASFLPNYTTRCINVQSFGQYSARMTDTFGCLGTTDTVFAEPFVPVVTAQNGSLCAPEGGSNYQWYLNGSLLSGQSSNCITNLVLNGNYYVQMTDAYGCEGISTPLVTSDNEANTLINPISRVYPNPTTGELQIDVPEPMQLISSILIFDIHGTQMLFKNTGASRNLNIEHLASGVYWIQLNTEYGIWRTKVVKI